MGKKAFYAVRRGRSVGIYDTWAQCKSQVNGYTGSQYKKFNTIKEAQEFVNANGTNTKVSLIGTSTSTAWPNEITNEKPATRKEGYGVYKPGMNKGTRAGGISKPQGSRYYSVKSTNPSIKSMIFSNWPECQKYVSGKRGLTYQKFSTQSDAANFIAGISKKDYEFIGMTEEEFTAKYKITESDVKFKERANVYCDGSAIGNGTSRSRAGYGVFFEDSGYSISEPLMNGPPTNNRAEIQAVSSALDEIWKKLTSSTDKIKYLIKTDSEYVAKLLNDRYMTFDEEKMSSFENCDLAYPLIKKFVKVKKFYEINGEHFVDGGKFQIQWVKGHAGEAGNEKADELARMGAAKDRQPNNFLPC